MNYSEDITFIHTGKQKILVTHFIILALLKWSGIVQPAMSQDVPVLYYFYYSIILAFLKPGRYGAKTNWDMEERITAYGIYGLKYEEPCI